MQFTQNSSNKQTQSTQSTHKKARLEPAIRDAQNVFPPWRHNLAEKVTLEYHRNPNWVPQESPRGEKRVADFESRLAAYASETNEPFVIKCCATTQTKALLYIYWLLMINTLFVERISCQVNFFAENIRRSFFSLWSRVSHDHVPGNEKGQISPICRYRTNLADFR